MPFTSLIFNIFSLPSQSPFMCRIIKNDMQITILEMEKSSSMQNFNNVYDLATEQTIAVQEKYEKVRFLAMVVKVNTLFTPHHIYGSSEMLPPHTPTQQFSIVVMVVTVAVVVLVKNIQYDIL